MLKKVVVLLFGVIFTLFVVGAALAQEKAKPAEPAKPAETAKPAEKAKPAEPAKPSETAKPAEPAKPEGAKKEVKKEAPAKAASYRVGGVVQSVDVKGRKITIQQQEVKKQRKLTLNVSKKEANQLAGVNVGDSVNAWVTGNTITKLVPVF